MDARTFGDLSLGDALRLHRRRTRLKNRELAEQLSIKESMLNRLLADTVTGIDLPLGRRLSEVLGVSMETIEEMYRTGRRSAGRESAAVT